MNHPANSGSQLKSLRPMSRFRDVVSRRATKFALALLLFTCLCAPLYAQGCTQCQDNTAATPPRTQAAYRHAILFMTISAGGLFLGTLLLLKRHR